MNAFYTLGALISAIATPFLGIFVYFKHRKSRVNQSFFWVMLATSFWSLFLYLAMNSQVEQRALWYSYLLHAGSIPIPVLFLSFVFSVLEEGRYRRRTLMAASGVTCLLLIFNFTPWFVSVAPSSGFRYFPRGGPIYPAFVLYFVIAASYGLWLLFKGYRTASGLKRNQLKYLLWCWLIGLSGGSLTFVPALGFEIPPWCFSSSYLITVGCVGEAYAIAKYRSLDINIVLRRGMAYSILLPSLTAGFLIVLLGVEHLLRSYIGYSSVVATAIAALILAMAFQPLKNQVQAWVDRVFFKGAYDYHKTLKETSEAMTSILNLERLADHLLSSILTDMRVTSGSLLLMHAKETGLSLLAHQVHASHQKSEPPAFLPRDSALVKTLEWDPDALMREGIKHELASKEGDKIVKEMAGLGAELAVPVTLQRRLLGILLLGPKLSGDPFSEEDLALLSTLANQAAVAIENARLYDEVTAIKEYLEHILRNLESGVITIDHEARITTFNRAAERMTQWKASEVLEKDCRILDKKLAHLLLSTLASGEGRSGVELILYLKERKSLPIGVTTSLLRNHQGDSLGVIALFGDLTEVKELEKEKWKAEKLAYLGTLAASIAHEIKNPLVSIKTFAQLLPERHADTEFRDHFSRIALKEVDRIDHLVSQMLDLKGNSNPPQFENLRVQEILEEILLLLSKQIEKENIHVERMYHPGDLAIFGDRFQLKQALWNVILNAVQAMEGGGILTVSTSLSPDGKKSEGKVVLKISDTGNGIPEDAAGKIFDPFFTTKKKGTGLGLAICNKIITDHHGSIQVESQVMLGTCMVISFPAVPS